MRRALLLMLATLVLTGCGASDPVASEDVSAAVEKTASVASSRVALTAETEDERVAMDGVIDYDDRQARLNYGIESKESGPAVTSEMLFVGTTAYMESSIFGFELDGAEASEQRKPKPWLSIDWAEQEPSLESLLFPFPFIDPTRLLDALEEVSGEVEGLGSKEIRGVETDGYALAVDLRRVVDEAPAAHRERLLSELERETRKSIPIDVWIDDDGFARRMVVHDEEEVAIDFYDFGVEFDVEAPPADQVDDFDEGWTSYAGDGDEEADSGVTVEEDE